MPKIIRYYHLNYRTRVIIVETTRLHERNVSRIIIHNSRRAAFRLRSQWPNIIPVRRCDEWREFIFGAGYFRPGRHENVRGEARRRALEISRNSSSDILLPARKNPDLRDAKRKCEFP